MVSKKEWLDSLFKAIEKTEKTSTEQTREEIDRLNLSRVEVNFKDRTNTEKIFNKVERDISNHTSVIVRLERETIQLEFCEKPMMDKIGGEKLIRKILEQDVPEREGIEVDYEFYNDFVLVKSPIKQPIELFPNLSTHFWVMTGLINKNGIYHQKFRQNSKMRKNKRRNPIESYGRNRLDYLSFNMSFSCPNCGDSFTYSYSDSLWSCEKCSESIEVEPSKLFDNIDPSLDKNEILEKIESKVLKELKTEK